MEINLKLKELRKKVKVSQIKLQMDTGIEQALISKYENGKRVPPTETLIELAEYFNVSLDYLIGRTEHPEINK
ncbi:MAG: helix-turn-helix transcriptional regulator [Clostridia bacterium]|nr:helix-turn-helix transcriptional regulator [Clostridia bacterium]